MSKSLAGQSQLILPIFVIVFASAVAIATNQTLNMTGFSVADVNASSDSLENASIDAGIDNTALVQDNPNIDNPVNESDSSSVNSSSDTPTIVQEGNNETQPIQAEEKPSLAVTIENQPKITRGESANIKAAVTNTGSAEAKDVMVSWRLPDGFVVVSGEMERSCGNLAPDMPCSSEIVVQTSQSAMLGDNQIKVEVNYG